MKKILAVVIVAIAILGGGVGAFVALKKDKTDTNATGTSESMKGMDMSQHQGSQPSDSSASQDKGTAGSTNTSTASGASNAVSTDQVKIANFAFSPATITIKVGTKVTWTNGDEVKHNIAMDDGADGPSSQMLGKGDTYTYAFTKAGTYNYHCTPHPYMKATVIVTE